VPMTKPIRVAGGDHRYPAGSVCAMSGRPLEHGFVSITIGAHISLGRRRTKARFESMFGFWDIRVRSGRGQHSHVVVKRVVLPVRGGQFELMFRGLPELWRFLDRLCDELEVDAARTFNASPNQRRGSVAMAGPDRWPETAPSSFASGARVCQTLGSYTMSGGVGSESARTWMQGYFGFRLGFRTPLSDMFVHHSVAESVTGGRVEMEFKSIAGLRRFFVRTCDRLARLFWREIKVLSRCVPASVAGVGPCDVRNATRRRGS
jgi:hypothetical protein